MAVLALWRFRDDIPLVRLAVVLVLFGAGTALLTVGERPGDMPGRDWYGAGRQRLLLADLSFRVSQALEWAAREWAVSLDDQARQFAERAVAEYERQGLTGPANPAALQRLGLIYGDRGYDVQAQEMLSQAAALDDRRSALFFAMASLFDPETPLQRVRGLSLEMLHDQETWLADLALKARATRLGDPAEAQAVAVVALHHTQHFAVNVLIIGLGYGLVTLLGAGILLRAGLLFLFSTRPARRPRPLLSVVWEPLDALEGAALLCFAMAAAAVALGFLGGSLGGASGSPTVHLGLVIAQYLIMSLIVLALVGLRVPGTLPRKLNQLGWRAPQVGRLVWEGLGSYGVLVCCLAAVAALFPSEPGPALLGWATVTRPVLGEALRSPASALVVFLFVTVVVPMIEETIFRGFVYAGLRRHWPVFTAAVGSALLFAAMHHSTEALVPIGLIGLVLAFVYERTRSLLPAVICHGLHNFLILSLLLITQ